MCSLWLSRFLLTVAQLKADQQQFTPHKFFFNLKKVQTHLRIKKKKGSNQTQPPLFPPVPHTHPHTHEHTTFNGSTLGWFIQPFFFCPRPLLFEVTVRIKHTIILFKRGLPVWGGVRVKVGWGGGCSLKVRAESMGSIRQGPSAFH